MVPQGSVTEPSRGCPPKEQEEVVKRSKSEELPGVDLEDVNRVKETCLFGIQNLQLGVSLHEPTQGIEHLHRNVARYDEIVSGVISQALHFPNICGCGCQEIVEGASDLNHHESDCLEAFKSV